MKRAILFTAVALATGAAQAAVTELQLYQHPNYQGASETIKGQVNNLQGNLSHQATSAVVLGGYWEVCTGDHFTGNCRVLEPGRYPRFDNGLDDKITSIRFLGNDPRMARNDARADARADAREQRLEERQPWRVAREARGSIELYGRPDFRGRSVRVDRNFRDLDRIEFDGRASSVVVNDGVWQLCTEPGFQGQCGVFRPGHYPQLAMLDDRVSSMRQLR
jgi:hypothetical protein